MCSPHLSAQRLPKSYNTGEQIHAILSNAIHDHPQLCLPVLTVLGGGHIPKEFTFPQHFVKQLRGKISTQLGQAAPPPYNGLQHHLFHAWIQASGGPDISLPVWLRSGAPLGLTVPVGCHGIFPIVKYQQPPHTVRDILTPDGEWSNYRSSEEDLITCTGLLQRMLDNNWAQSFNGKEELLDHNTTDIILSKLGFITKTKPDGSTKHRLVWDFLRSKVNSLIHQGERIILPRVSDFVECILLDVHNSGEFSEDTLDTLMWLSGIDISDAFRKIPRNSSEKRFAVAFINNKFWCSIAWFSAAVPRQPRGGDSQHSWGDPQRP
jgi:hypothetical protein